MNQPPWMAHAWADLGLRESPGSSSNPRITAYFHALGHDIGDDATAWCAAFVGACLERGGVPSTRSLLARSYLDWGTPTTNPAPGAIAVLSRGGDATSGHVGFLVGETATHVVLLGGNQSDSVSVAAFERTRVLGFRAPPAGSAPSPPPAAPAASPPQSPSSFPDDGFAAALTLVLAHEGGWTDDPFDPGGATNRGITIGDFARERGVIVTAQTIDDLKYGLRHIGNAEVQRIYLERYWRPARCPDLPAPLALFHFDAAVNQGVTGAARMLQEALDVAIDGEIGPLTLAAAEACEPSATLDSYAAIRRRRYRSLSTFWRFGRGWLARVDATLAAARALAGRPPAKPSLHKEPPSMSSSAPAPADAALSKSEPAPAKWWGESLTIWGSLLTAATTVAPAIFSAFGIDLSPDLIAKLGRDTLTAVQAVTGLVGTVMTILGRVRARAPLARHPLQLRI